MCKLFLKESLHLNNASKNLKRNKKKEQELHRKQVENTRRVRPPVAPIASTTYHFTWVWKNSKSVRIPNQFGFHMGLEFSKPIRISQTSNSLEIH